MAVSLKDMKLDTPKALNIDTLLGEAKNRVVKIGIELEGAWKSLPPDCSIENDASVFKGHKPKDYPYIGEIPIGPWQPAAIVKSLKRYYPHKTDYTCGMHVHMSFTVLRHYLALMVPEYQETMIDYLKAWAMKEGFPPGHHIYDRLSGKSIYCQKKFWPIEQANNKKKEYDQQKTGHRYTIINYCGRWNTVEVRVLPMMDTPEQAVRAIKLVKDITNACLIKLGKFKEEKIVGKIQLSDTEFYEEYFEDKAR